MTQPCLYGDTRGLPSSAVDSGAQGSGVLLVRAWLQNGQVVARLRWSRSGHDEQRAEAVAGAEQVEAAVRRWLRELTDPPPAGSADPPGV